MGLRMAVSVLVGSCIWIVATCLWVVVLWAVWRLKSLEEKLEEKTEMVLVAIRDLAVRQREGQQEVRSMNADLTAAVAEIGAEVEALPGVVQSVERVIDAQAQRILDLIAANAEPVEAIAQIKAFAEIVRTQKAELAAKALANTSAAPV